jgi:hypothetical protein
VTDVPVRVGQSVSGSRLSFQVPAGWRAGGSRPDIPGLGLKSEIVARPPAATAGEAVAGGFTTSTDPSLLPPAFWPNVLNPRIRPQRVRVRAGPAYRYAGLQLRSGTLLTVVAIPTSDGVATMACRGSSGSQVARACGAVASTFRLRGVRVFSPPPRADYARAVNGALAEMVAAETAARTRLSAARSARALARALDGLAAGYGTAAVAVGRIRPAPYEAGRTQALEGQLRELQRLHAVLRDAARRRARARYRRTRALAVKARAGLGPRLATLRALGYDVTARPSG